MRILPALLIASCLMGPAHAALTAPSTTDEQAVLAADQAFYQTSLTRKGQSWADFADDDAVLPAGKGKIAIGAYYDKVYARPGYSLSWVPDYAKVVGDVGVSSGHFESHVLDASGHDKRGHGTYVTVWARQKDGGWRYVWDGGTVDP